MSATADRLTRLPTLIQTEIMVQLETESSIKTLCEAYPSMHSLYNRYERGILESILANLLADDVEAHIERDILAIIEFSNPRGEFGRQFESRQLDLKELQWPEWPDFPQLEDLRLIHRVLSRIVAFIEDYISKATSDYPPRAYLGVPDLETGNMSFMGNLLETKILRFTSLTRSERYRLLRAFVRYELLCKIHNYSFYRWEVPTGFETFNAFGAPGAADPKALLSVHEYYKALYGAVIAHCGDAWLPGLPSSSSATTAEEITSLSTMHGRPLLYPDNVYFDADVYDGDLLSSGVDVAEELASRGLDLLTRVLNCLKGMPEGRLYIKKWLKKLANEQEYGFEPWIRTLYDPRHDDQYSAYRELITSSQFFHELSEYEGKGENINHYLLSNNTLRYDKKLWWTKVHKLQLQIYWQRAWGLFDDQRFYPIASCHFPTLDELAALAGGKTSSDYRYKRRSKHWQDYWAGNRADRPKTFQFQFSGTPERFFHDTEDLDLPEIWTDYQPNPDNY